jgi:hypothetical protein
VKKDVAEKKKKIENVEKKFAEQRKEIHIKLSRELSIDCNRGTHYSEICTEIFINT